jgi:D-threonine aldolase
MMWFRLKNAEEVPSPALLVDVDRVEENIQRMVTIAGGPERLRPHVKTHKMAAIVERKIAAGITKFKCATIAEAEMTARAGAPDVLLAMQPVGPNIARLFKLKQTFPKTIFSTLIDDANAARCLALAGKMDIWIDIDPGMGRCGISPENAPKLFETIQKLPNLTLRGLHTYDGHIHEKDVTLRAQQCDEAFVPVAALAKKLSIEKIIAGGTPTFPMHAARPAVECSPGTVVLHDFGYTVNFPDLDFKIAAVVLTRVVSKPAPGRICLDLGHKSIASENPHPRAFFVDLPDPRVIMHSEEHLVLETPAADRLNVGDVIIATPKHICPTVALYSEAITVRNQIAGERWPVTARNRILTL